MAEESSNRQVALKHLRRGLAIYKTGRSPFWNARLYDPAKKRYVVRSTKETTRLDAAEVAEEIVATYLSKQNSDHAARKERSFEHYAKLLSELTKQKAKATRNKYAFSDQAKILFREGDGLVSYFGKHDVGKITSGMVRDYPAIPRQTPRQAPRDVDEVKTMRRHSSGADVGTGRRRH